MGSRRDTNGQMILLAGLLLVMAYLIFSTQTALLATVGQDAGREATNPAYQDFVGIRSGLAQIFKQELTDSGGTVRCPTYETNWIGRVDTILAMITQLESNRGQVFKGSLEDTVITPGVRVTTTLSLYLTNGDATMFEEITYVTLCA